MKRFEVKPEHIKLLQHAYIGWEDCEFGAPSIDCKRPYGNSSVYYDIAEILGIECDEDEGFTREQKDLMDVLHRGTLNTLQIALRTGSFVPGVYEARDYDTDWKLVPDAQEPPQ